MRPGYVPTPSDMTVASARLRDARRVRGDTLLGLTSGALSVGELCELAQLSEWRPLRRITLHAVLRSLGLGETRTRRLLARIRSSAGVDPGIATRDLTIGWVLDRRATGRTEALADALLATSPRVAPAPHWPYATTDDGGAR